MTIEELIPGGSYWFCDSRKITTVPLDLMNKVKGRKAYRFCRSNTNKVYLIHETTLKRKLFHTHRECCLHLASILKNRAASYERRAEPQQTELTAPRLDRWAVARGFPIPARFGRR
jgi:hypothetical protein